MSQFWLGFAVGSGAFGALCFVGLIVGVMIATPRYPG